MSDPSRPVCVTPVGLKVVLMALAIIGSIPLPLGVVGREGSTLIVVANGLRLLICRSS